VHARHRGRAQCQDFAERRRPPLREKGFGFADLTMKASCLTPEEFPIFQRAVANLRDNLVKASKGEL
jgi:hypothetical protein